MSETIVDLNFLEAGVQCFPMYHYEERKIELCLMMPRTPF